MQCVVSCNHRAASIGTTDSLHDHVCTMKFMPGAHARHIESGLSRCAACAYSRGSSRVCTCRSYVEGLNWCLLVWRTTGQIEQLYPLFSDEVKQNCCCCCCCRTFGEVYPELVSARDKIHSVISEEEASFSRTLVKGIERFKKLAAAAQVR